VAVDAGAEGLRRGSTLAQPDDHVAVGRLYGKILPRLIGIDDGYRRDEGYLVIVLVFVIVPVQSHCSWILSQIFPSMIMTTVTTFVLKKYQSW